MDFQSYKKDGVTFHERTTEKETLETFKELLHNFIEVRGISPKDIQVYSPIYENAVGVNEMNAVFQEYLIEKNLVDGAQCIIHNGKKFCVGDKIHRAKKNDYKRGIMNGNVGYITGVNQEDLEIEVDFGGGLTPTFMKSELQTLDLAYCIISGKGQGSGVKYVITPISRTQFQALNKEMIYTFVTRAIKEAHIIGQKDALKIAVAKSGLVHRYSSLRSLLKNPIDYILDKPIEE